MVRHPRIWWNFEQTENALAVICVAEAIDDKETLDAPKRSNGRDVMQLFKEFDRFNAAEAKRGRCDRRNITQVVSACRSCYDDTLWRWE